MNHAFDEPKQWEIREINEIMNQCIARLAVLTEPKNVFRIRQTKGLGA